VPNLTISTEVSTTLEGQPRMLNCSAAEDEVVVKWLFNGTEIALNDERYMFSPPGLNNILTIINPSTSESGNYSCRIDVDEMDIESTVIVTVLAGMDICTYVGTCVELMLCVLNTVKIIVKEFHVCTYFKLYFLPSFITMLII